MMSDPLLAQSALDPAVLRLLSAAWLPYSTPSRSSSR